ncbi:hypothetical protein MMC09_002936 [Bachmanniomyces sp. S44760]|nr:hypothetical protein [Bachmanniomyces sp. S44760]
MCQAYLQKGECPAGGVCDLSHDPTPERVSPCLHFLRGNCSNPSCRYPHVYINPSAPVCKDFANMGYCAKGANCLERHARECPDYANTGTCRNKRCTLPHVDRAGKIRKLVTDEADHQSDIIPGGPSQNYSDVSSEEEEQYVADSDDVDSSDVDTTLLQIEDDNDTVSLFEQKDFVKF